MSIRIIEPAWRQAGDEVSNSSTGRIETTGDDSITIAW